MENVEFMILIVKDELSLCILKALSLIFSLE